MDPIKANNSVIYFDNSGYTSLNNYINDGGFSKIFILVDENTHMHCLSYFLSNLEIDTDIIIKFRPIHYTFFPPR